MDSKKVPPVYLKLNSDLVVSQNTIPFKEVFGLDYSASNLYYSFETQFSPYAPYILGRFDNIDLVTIDTSGGETKQLRGLEVKLTAVPDNTTRDRESIYQGAEIVIRPQTIFYLAMRIADCYKNERPYIQDKLNPICQGIRNWSDMERVSPYLAAFTEAINDILLNKINNQSPFVLQPIWRSEGVSPRLANDCLDMFIWSDMAFTRLFVDGAARSTPGTKLNRLVRSVFWLAKMLFDFAVFGQFNPREVKDLITFDTGNDKAFAAGGLITNPYMRSGPLETPRIKKDEIREIILGGGENYLQPERRLDAAILMTPGLFR